MAETIKKGVIKKKIDENNSVILYPKTTADQIEYESKTFTLENLSSLPYQYEYFFAELIPDDLEKAYSATVDILVENDGIVVSNNQTMWLHSYRCVFGSQPYRIDETSTSPVSSPGLTAIQWMNGDTRTGSGSYYFKSIAMRMLHGNEYRSAITSGHGHIFGLRNETNTTFTTSGNINITIKVYNTTNCKIKFLNDVSIVATSSNLTLNGYTYNSWGTAWLSALYGNQLNSSSIESAKQTVYVNSYMNDNTTYYITGANGTGITTENRNGNIYIRQNKLYSNAGGFVDDNTQYMDGSIIRNGNTLNLPNSSGTIALKSDITSISIEDLTNINE